MTNGRSYQRQTSTKNTKAKHKAEEVLQTENTKAKRKAEDVLQIKNTKAKH